MSTSGEGDVTSRTTEIVRRTYEQLVRTRKAQIKYMAGLRRRRKERFGSILSPDLVVQYNFTYRLLRSLRTGLPVEVCVEDGGAACSVLTILELDSTGARPVIGGYPKKLIEAADGSDYLGARIVDLFDMPLSDGGGSGGDLTVRVRDEFAANIKTLNQLFEERYRLCQEQSARLRNEIDEVGRQLAVSRDAATAIAADSISRPVADRQIESLRDRIARYEIQTSVIKEQLDALNDIKVNSIERNRREIDSLSRILDESSASSPFGRGEAMATLLRRLVDDREAEREQVAAALQQLGRIDDSRVGDENSARSGGDVKRDEYEKRFQNAVEACVETELATKYREIEERIVREVDCRRSIIEASLREKFESELKRLSAELENGFSEAVANDIARRINESIRVVTVPELSSLSGGGSNSTKDVDVSETTKRVLDGVRELKTSVQSVVRLEDMSDGYTDEVALSNSVYRNLNTLLTKARDLYTFVTLQNVYLKITAANAYEHYVPPPPNTTRRTEVYKTRINNIVGRLGRTKRDNELELKKLLETMCKKLRQSLLDYRKSTQNTETYQRGIRLDELHEQAKKIAELYRTKRVDPNGSTRRRELELLRSEGVVKRSTVRELQQSLTATSPGGSTAFGRDKVASYVAQNKVRKEKALRDDLLHGFTRLYVELADYIMGFTDEFDEWVKKVVDSDKRLDENLRGYRQNLKNLLDEADRVIGLKRSSEYNPERYTKLFGIK